MNANPDLQLVIGIVFDSVAFHDVQDSDGH